MYTVKVKNATDGDVSAIGTWLGHEVQAVSGIVRVRLKGREQMANFQQILWMLGFRSVDIAVSTG